MVLVSNNLPLEGTESNGSIEFIHENYMYNIGTLDDVLWISRQTVADYENGTDNWERIERWVPENNQIFTLMRGKHI